MDVEKKGLWDGGWLRHARHRPSPNANARPEGAVIDLIVLHSISLPPGRYQGDAVERLFINRLDTEEHPYYRQLVNLQVSAHFFIRRDGAVIQFVDTRARAWHAGVSHWRGRDRCNDDSIGIELEGLEGHPFEATQYNALITLGRWLRLLHPIRHVAGHEHIAPDRKKDPGPGFEWQRLQRAVGWSDLIFPIPLD